MAMIMVKRPFRLILGFIVIQEYIIELARESKIIVLKMEVVMGWNLEKAYFEEEMDYGR